MAACVASPELAENKCLEVVSETTAPALSYEDLLEAHPSGKRCCVRRWVYVSGTRWAGAVFCLGGTCWRPTPLASRQWTAAVCRRF